MRVGNPGVGIDAEARLTEIEVGVVGGIKDEFGSPAILHDIELRF